MKPRLYTKRPVSVMCLELTPETFDAAVRWVGLDIGSLDVETCKISIKTLEGVMVANKGDFIICGLKGEFYPCKADIFHMTYNEGTP